MKLCYNDYGAEVQNAKSDRMYLLVKGLLERKVPIDCVGFQATAPPQQRLLHHHLTAVACRLTRVST